MENFIKQITQGSSLRGIISLIGGGILLINVLHIFSIPLLIIGITFMAHGILGITTDDSLILAKNTISQDLKKIEVYAEEEAAKFKEELLNKLYNNQAKINVDQQKIEPINNIIGTANIVDKPAIKQIVNQVPVASQLGNLIGNTIVYSDGTVEYKAI